MTRDRLASLRGALLDYEAYDGGAAEAGLRLAAAVATLLPPEMREGLPAHLVGGATSEAARDEDSGWLLLRLCELERATAVAYLDANLEGPRYDEEAAKVARAQREGKHYRLVVKQTPRGGACATIEVGD